MSYNYQSQFNTQSQKSRCSFCLGAQSPCARCSGNLYSSSQSRENLTSKPTSSALYSYQSQSKESSTNKPASSFPSQQFSQTGALYPSYQSKESFPSKSSSQYISQHLNQAENQKIQSFTLPSRNPYQPLKNKCHDCQEREAQRLCLNCEKICCDSCALDIHNSHSQSLLKLKDVPGRTQYKSTELEKMMSGLENSIRKEGSLSEALKAEEEMQMIQVDSFFQECYNILQKQEVFAKTQIQNKFQEISAEYDRSAQKDSAREWISQTKDLFRDLESKRADSIALLRLEKQQKSYENLDTSNFKGNPDKDLEKILNQIQVQCNDALLESLKTTKAVEVNIKNNKPGNPLNTPSYVESARRSFADTLHQGMSQNPNQYQNSSSIRNPQSNLQNQAASEKKQKNLQTDFNSAKKTDVTKAFIKAFTSQKLEIWVSTEQDLNQVLLTSKFQKNSQSGGLKSDEDVKLFSEILKEDRLQEPCKKVSCLKLDCLNLTLAGIASLTEVFNKLKWLQAIYLSFSMASGFSTVDTKDLFNKISKLTSLKKLSLKFPSWTRLKNSNFVPLLSGTSLNINLKSLVLDFSECNQLDLAGISEGLLTYPLKHATLGKLFVSFKGCVNLKNENNVLKTLSEKCLTSNVKTIEIDFTGCSNLHMAGSMCVITSEDGKQMKFYNKQK